ncbi:MAG: hypothetical protein GC137_08170 [Alphaproteobacteria bacterium]|nr:hypothetical protein [Alphaproteobacteria bacterium]
MGDVLRPDFDDVLNNWNTVDASGGYRAPPELPDGASAEDQKNHALAIAMSQIRDHVVILNMYKGNTDQSNRILDDLFRDVRQLPQDLQTRVYLAVKKAGKEGGLIHQRIDKHLDRAIQVAQDHTDNEEFDRLFESYLSIPSDDNKQAFLDFIDKVDPIVAYVGCGFILRDPELSLSPELREDLQKKRMIAEMEIISRLPPGYNDPPNYDDIMANLPHANLNIDYERWDDARIDRATLGNMAQAVQSCNDGTLASVLRKAYMGTIFTNLIYFGQEEKRRTLLSIYKVAAEGSDLQQRVQQELDLS